MPRGGQISAGSGLRLQSTSPGTKDIGNFNISGIGRSTGGVLSATGPYQVNEGSSLTATVYGLFQTFRNPGLNSGGSVYIGSGQIIGGLAGAGASSILEQVLIGGGVQCGARGNTVIGNAAIVEPNINTGANIGFNVAIGRSVSITSDELNSRAGNVVIGANSTLIGGICTAIGFGQNLSGKTGAVAKGGVYIGQYIKSTAGGNQIIIDTRSVGSGALPDETRSNLIKIGDATQDTIEIGGITMPKIYNYWGNQNVPTTYANSVAEFTIVSMVPIVRNLASTTQLRVLGEGYISCTGTPTLQLRVKWGTGAQVLIASPATTLPAGLANAPFKINFTLAIGSNPSATTSVIGSGTMDIWTGTAWFTISLTMTALTNIDTQVVNNPNNGLWIGAIWGTAAAGNSLTMNMASTEGRFNYQ